MKNAPHIPSKSTLTDVPAAVTLRPGRSAPGHLRQLGAAALATLALGLVAGLSPSKPADAQVPGSVLFTALGETQSVTVPSGVLGAYVVVDGGGGGQGYDGLGSPSSGGAGAEVTGTLLLQAGDVLTVDVGSQGQDDTVNPTQNPAPAWGGDAPGGTSYGSDTTVGGGGGGASSVLLSGDYQLMAGGGGGGGGSGTLGGIDKGGNGGAGGTDGIGSNGGNGSGPGHGDGGKTGSQSGKAGGAGGPEHHDAGPGGGGGGGWEGGAGGGGGSTGGGGGGGGGAGDSYIGGSAVLDGTIDTASEAADGMVNITWIYSPVCIVNFAQSVSAFDPTQLTLPCFFQGVPGTEITFGIAEHGTLSVVDAATGTIEYTPDQQGWVGADQFTFTVTNANGAVATGSVQVLSQTDGVRTTLSTSQASPGDQVDVKASGLKPNEKVQVELHSTPTQLATLRADSKGNVHTTVQIPAKAPIGAHQIALRGATSGLHTSPIVVTGSATTSTGTPWGVIALSAMLGAAAVAAIGALMIHHRRKALAEDPATA